MAPCLSRKCRIVLCVIALVPLVGVIGLIGWELRRLTFPALYAKIQPCDSLAVAMIAALVTHLFTIIIGLQVSRVSACCQIADFLIFILSAIAVLFCGVFQLLVLNYEGCRSPMY